MSFTYDLSTNIGKFRLRMWDTDSDNPIFQDDEITALIDIFGSVTRAMIQACYALHSKYTMSSSSDIKVDDISIKDSGISKASKYLELAKQLEHAITMGLDPDELPDFFFGGVYNTDLNSNLQSRADGVLKSDDFPVDVFDTFPVHQLSDLDNG